MSEESKKKRSSDNSTISNSKAKGVLILIGALLVFQIGTFIWDKLGNKEGTLTPNSNNHLLDSTYNNRSSSTLREPGKSNVQSSAKGSRQKTNAPFVFNPNTISLDSLMLLGFSQKQGLSILKYRDKGGQFRKREDFAKMYVVSKERYAQLESYIVIPERGERPDEQVAQSSKELAAASENNLSGVKKGWVKYKDTVAIAKAKWVCNINTADSATFVKLYGVGGYFAKKILRYRERLGGSFVHINQLLEVDGIDEERFNGFKEKLLVDTTQIKKFSFKKCEKKFLEQHPYIGAYAARGILLYVQQRKGEGEISLNDLVKENILERSAAQRLTYYVE